MPKVKGPKDGKIVTARFDGKAKSIFPNLKETKNLVLLSIKGNEFCAGEYLGAIIQCAISNYGSTTLLIADEVGWHNLKNENFSPSEEEQLRQKARDLGAQYFEENLVSFLNPLDIKLNKFNEEYKLKNAKEKADILNKMYASNNLQIEIIFWHDWINSQNHIYNQKKLAIHAQYKSINTLAESLELTAKAYAQRKHDINEYTQAFDQQLNISKDYLLEECPALIWIAASLDYNFITYAGDINNALSATIDTFIIAENDFKQEDFHLRVKNKEKLVNWLHINFKRQYNEDQKNILAPNLQMFFNHEIVQNINYFYIKAAIAAILEFHNMNIETKAELIAGILKNLVTPSSLPQNNYSL